MPSHDSQFPLLRTVREVIDALGGPTATASRIRVTLPAVSYYLRNGCFPRGRYLDISTALEELGYRVDRSLFHATPRSKSETHAA
jgi:hypothetical protein